MVDQGLYDLDSGFHLFAAVFAVDAPVHEVFAVVGNEAVKVFAQAASGAADALRGVVSSLGVLANAAAAAADEFGEADFFNTDALSAANVVQSGVVDNSAAADVEAVMAVADAWAH